MKYTLKIMQIIIEIILSEDVGVK